MGSPSFVSPNNYAVTIPLEEWITLISVEAANAYGASASRGIMVTRADFTVRNLGDTGNVTVLEVSGDYNAKAPDGSQNDEPRKTAAKEYFKTHADADFLVYLTTFDYALPEAGAQGFYSEVKNDTQGINRSLFDNSTQFGSPGKLQGTVDLGNVTALATNPYGPKVQPPL